MDDLISRKEAINALNRLCLYPGEWAVNGLDFCKDAIANLPSIDAVPVEKYVPERNVGEWDMFDMITSAYYGKTMYFKQDNGIVYSRYSCKYMSVDEAIREFLALIGDIE